MDSATCPIATFDCELEHPNLINITSNDEKVFTFPQNI